MARQVSTVVERPRRDPWALARKAEAAGLTPKAMVIGVLSRTASYEAAAAELQVTTRALLRYRRFYQIEVRKQ